MRTLAFFNWMAGIAAGIWLLGFGITMPVFVFLYTKLQAKAGWVFSLAMTAGTGAFTWGFFEYALGLRGSRDSFPLTNGRRVANYAIDHLDTGGTEGRSIDGDGRG